MRNRIRRIVFFSMIGLLLITLAVGYLSADAAYRKMNKEKYTPELEWIETVMSREKQWILQNQGADGEIYMNGEAAGNINPYFACQAALGLLENTGDQKAADAEIDAVRRYLNWHTKLLLESEGLMGTYRKKGESLARTDKADSVDAYLGVYLELLGRYLLTSESTDGLIGWKEGIHLAMDTLWELTVGGLTCVSYENDTKYLMDNLEVWKGLTVLEECFHSRVLYTEDIRELSEVRIRADTLRARMEVRIPEEFWNSRGQKWLVMAGDYGFDSTKFYPDGIAQVYPLIFDFPVNDRQSQRELYQAFTDNLHWQSIPRDGTHFVWAMAGMAAVRTKDVINLRTFLEEYDSMYADARKYPLYTGEAGWVCRNCAGLYRIYSAEMNRHLFWPAGA